jgi:hypothetical protein
MSGRYDRAADTDVSTGLVRMTEMQTGAQAQGLFREVNERIREIHSSFDDGPGGRGPISFICECANIDCADLVDATLDAYAEARARPTRFLLATGHENGGRIVATGAAWVVVDHDGDLDGNDAFTQRRRAQEGGSR